MLPHQFIFLRHQDISHGGDTADCWICRADERTGTAFLLQLRVRCSPSGCDRRACPSRTAALSSLRKHGSLAEWTLLVLAPTRRCRKRRIAPPLSLRHIPLPVAESHPGSVRRESCDLKRFAEWHECQVVVLTFGSFGEGGISRLFCLEVLVPVQRVQRADEQIRTAELISLRVRFAPL